jgi:hypothetical protein
MSEIKKITKPSKTAKEVTVEGVTYKVNENVFNNLEVLEALDDIQSGENSLAFIKLSKLVLGERGYKKLKESIKDKDGYVDAQKAVKIIMEVIQAIVPK